MHGSMRAMGLSDAHLGAGCRGLHAGANGCADWDVFTVLVFTTLRLRLTMLRGLLIIGTVLQGAYEQDATPESRSIIRRTVVLCCFNKPLGSRNKQQRVNTQNPQKRTQPSPNV